jgi:hypothetical protein
MTLYDIQLERLVLSPSIHADREPWEEKLLLRLRQLRKNGEGQKLLIDPKTGEVSVINAPERLYK